MCGLTGKIYLDRSRAIDRQELKQMTDTLYHRGPDDAGFYVNNNIGLGFRRLSIIDVEKGHQPISNEDNSIWIVFNGEIYNYQELHRDLVKKGHVFKTNSDTETLIHLYEQYGNECVKYINGMFAFAIWDNNKNQLFCVRDRFGIKPFYYYSDEEKFVFGSEIKAIISSNDINKSISYDAINSYFSFGYISSDLSIYREIRKLQPAHYLLLSFDHKPTIQVKKYWDIQFEPDYSKNENQWAEEIEEGLSNAVKYHMIADVPVGAFLSGGIDSSAMLALMAQHSSKPIETFSIGFKEEKYNELKHARQVAGLYGCNYHEQIIEPESISLLSKLVKAYDEPFADSSAIPTYYVSKFAREHVKVVLSGDGGDELFAGYNLYRYLKKVYRCSSSYPSFNKFFWGNINKLIPQKMYGKGFTNLLSQNRETIGAHLCIWPNKEKRNLILPDITSNFKKIPELIKEEILKKGYKNDFITNLQNLDLQTYMTDDILTKVDRASMMNSLEVRIPFLDHKFAELSFKIPSRLKLNGSGSKYILRKSMKKYLPEKIVKLPKNGFSLPLTLWFKNEYREYVNDTLLSGSALFTIYLDQKFVKQTIEDNRVGIRDFSRRIWSLLCFEEWLQQNKTISLKRIKDPRSILEISK